jgi:hypothetical protein
MRAIGFSAVAEVSVIIPTHSICPASEICVRDPKYPALPLARHQSRTSLFRSVTDITLATSPLRAKGRARLPKLLNQLFYSLGFGASLLQEP